MCEMNEYDVINLSGPKILNQKPNLYRRCPVITTISDTNTTAVDIQQLLEAGMNIAKIKISSTTISNRLTMLNKIDKAASKCCIKYGVKNWPIATCVELKNFIVKTGILAKEVDSVRIKLDSKIIITNNIKEYNKCNEEKIFIDNPYLAKEIKVGTEICIGSDEITMTCTEIVNQNSIVCNVIKGGMLESLSYVCAREIKHSRPHITEKDLEILKFALEYQIDIIIINYVRETKSIEKIKQFIKGKKVKSPMILCGIAEMDGLKNIDEILKIADGIVLSRDFLPYELANTNRYKLPNIQKWVAAKCLQTGIPLFICGGVFEDALKSGKIQYNEIADVTNALLDGISGFILKECFHTDRGVEILKTLNKMSYSIDPLTTYKPLFLRLVEDLQMPVNAAEAAVISCAMAAIQTDSKVVIVPTVSGKSVRALIRMRLSCLIIAVSADIRITRLLHINRGVVPLLLNDKDYSYPSWSDKVNGHILFALEYAVHRRWMNTGDLYVVLQRESQFSSFCDMVKINIVNISKKILITCPDDNKPNVNEYSNSDL